MAYTKYIAALVLCALSVPSYAVPVTYTVTNLGVGTATAINDHGDVVISSQENSRGIIQVYSNGGITDLGIAGDADRADINNQGQVVGTTRSAVGYAKTAFFYDNGVTTYVGGPNNAYTEAISINNSGQGVGFVQDMPGPSFFLYSGGAVDYFYPAGARAINDNGLVAGSTANGAYIYDSSIGGITDNIVSPYPITDAVSINNSGQVVGQFGRTVIGGPGGFIHAFLYSNGTTTDLGVLDHNPSNPNSTAYSINDHSQIVGWSGEHAFLYSGGAMVDLNSLIAPDSGWVLHTAYDINNNGQIVGIGWQEGQGSAQAFLLTPQVVPIPPAVLLFGSALAGLGVMRRKISR